MEFNRLTKDLLNLAAELKRRGVPFLLGGGMGLYVRTTYHPTERQPRYEKTVPIRPTKDLDVFLTGDVIASIEQMSAVRDALCALGYASIEGSEHFQFEIRIDGEQRARVDLLAAPPSSADAKLVKVNGPRIKPVRATGIHARLTPEAASIGEDFLAITVEDEGVVQVVNVPSSINYIVLKLHAYADRRVKGEDHTAEAHALDIFRIVTDMTEDDWRSAQAHMRRHGDDALVRRAQEIRRAYFGDLYADGVRALRRTAAFKAAQVEFEGYLEDVIVDLEELLRAGE